MSSEGPLTAHRPERVAVVIPAKNEADRIEATIDAARALHGVDIVVVVDDGSTDSTAAVAMGADALVVRHKTNRGKAAAMATGAQLVQMREDTDRADGGDSFIEELHAEPREPGHTGPLPVIDPAPAQPRALLFLDADMGASASGAQPLVDAVLEDGVDMAIALLPPQEGAAGMGFVVRTARRGIEKATGWTPTQPLSGTRCITRETWEACQPLAAGWGVETSLTIDALTGGFWVKEIEAELHHRATGSDLRGQLHRAAQLRDVLRALARRRTIAPEPPVEIEPETPLDDIEETGEHEVRSAPDAPVAPGRDAADLADLPVTGTFSDEQTRALADADIAALDRLLRDLPVDADFAPDDAVFLAGTDLDLLATRLHDAPVSGTFTPEHAVIIASHLDAGEPEIPPSLDSPLTPDEYASLVVHAAVDAENSAKSDS
ncbi:MAG TPA: glycosyltransferase [Candidatus Brachybacterium merdigallinarum]|nr:glycosyltransferase [Candidatus Brachybacterium merdigallinarum]